MKLMPVGQTTINWPQLVSHISTEMIQREEAKNLRFDSISTLLSALKNVGSGVNAVYGLFHYTFYFEMQLDQLIELVNAIPNMKIASYWEDDQEKGFVTISLYDMRNFVLEYASANKTLLLRQAANIFYAFLLAQKLHVLFAELVQQQKADGTFILVPHR